MNATSSFMNNLSNIFTRRYFDKLKSNINHSVQKQSKEKMNGNIPFPCLTNGPLEITYTLI